MYIYVDAIHTYLSTFFWFTDDLGRAIRHKDDFAAILLLDHRYMRASVKSKLPGWINERLQVIERFGPAFASIRKVAILRLLLFTIIAII